MEREDGTRFKNQVMDKKVPDVPDPVSGRQRHTGGSSRGQEFVWAADAHPSLSVFSVYHVRSEGGPIRKWTEPSVIRTQEGPGSTSNS